MIVTSFVNTHPEVSGQKKRNENWVKIKEEFHESMNF
jgi:hypothetical protein